MYHKKCYILRDILCGYVEILKAINLPKSEWEVYSSWKENRYTRNCISSCDDYELLLLCWQKEHESPIHNYDFQEGWIKVLSGELIIESYAVDRDERCATKKDKLVLKEGETTYLNDSMGFHKVSNASDGNTVSLHLNIGPVKKWEVFRSCRQSLETVEPILDKKSDDCDL
jgi:cysteine dioxygenase